MRPLMSSMFDRASHGHITPYTRVRCHSRRAVSSIAGIRTDLWLPLPWKLPFQKLPTAPELPDKAGQKALQTVFLHRLESSNILQSLRYGNVDEAACQGRFQG